MHCFLDSNVVIGRIFSLDPLNDFSKKINFESHSLYFSQNVADEVCEKFNPKLSQYQDFFASLKNYLEGESNWESLCSLRKFSRFLNNFEEGEFGFKKKNMYRALTVFWNDCKLHDNPTVFDLISVLGDYLMEMGSYFRDEKENFFNKSTIISNHTIKPQYLVEIIENKDFENFHDEDIEILYDFEEFAKNNQHLNFSFITGDDDFFNAVNSLIDFLYIYKVINLFTL